MPELTVSKKTVAELLSGGDYVIPDYQRPYSWDEEKCGVLWDDIVEFSESKTNSYDGDDYFLGTIVICRENNGEIHVIDGQQRIISLMLLLRAFYAHLEEMPADPKVDGLKRQIEPCVWHVDRIEHTVKDPEAIRIHSKVATEKDNDVFHEIMSTGKYLGNRTASKYKRNFDKFREWCARYATDAPFQWHDLCVNIFTKCVLLPIECTDVDAGLTIFNTLNDRGLELSDSDVFKAKIYQNKKTDKEKQEFIVQWRKLEQNAEDAGVSITDLFRYYSHYLRGKAKNEKKEVALRKFYAQKQNRYEEFNNAHSTKLIDDLIILSELWINIHRYEPIEPIKAGDKESKEVTQYLHCLLRYPNEYWKYIVSVFYLKNRDSDQFGSICLQFLKKLVAFLYKKFIERPTVNAIKGPTYKACIGLCTHGSYEFSGTLYESSESFRQRISTVHNSRVAFGLMLLHAYLNPKQTEIIPANFQIEHIFPKKWQSANYNGWDREGADQYLNKFGNRIAIEKRLNTQAGNKYFGEKKTAYQRSTIANVQELSKYHKDDWIKGDIEARDKEFANTIYAFFHDQLNLEEPLAE